MNSNMTPDQLQAFAGIIDSVWESFPLTGAEPGAADFDRYYSTVVDAVQASKYCNQSDISRHNMAWFILIGMEVGKRIERLQQKLQGPQSYTGA